MESIVEYISAHKKFFLLLLVILIVYYAIIITVYGIPKKKKKERIIKNLIKKENNKNFSIFDKNSSNPSIGVEESEKSKNEDWLDAFNKLDEQSFSIENDFNIDDLLDESGISPPKEED